MKIKDHEEIIPIWQPIGKSTNYLTKQLAERLGKKTTHTGTLDPMAEGVVIVLAGESRFKKLEWTSWKKTYEFEITFGIETDSFDGLGLIKNNDVGKGSHISKKQLVETLKTFVGNYIQTVPLYSAIKYKGKKLHHHARNGTHIETLPQKEGQIYKIALKELYETSLAEKIKHIIEKIKLIEGDLRQNLVIKGWKELLDSRTKNRKVQTARILVETSRGIYIRSLSQDICKKLGTIGFVSSLKRQKNGTFGESECILLKGV